ncbi:hypothetical protein ACWY4P_07165 [Streptomyces sp. LZ34]
MNSAAYAEVAAQVWTSRGGTSSPGAATLRPPSGRIRAWPPIGSTAFQTG